MANNYYTFDDPFMPGTQVRSDEVNTEYSDLEGAFDFFPTETDAINRGIVYLGTESGSGNSYDVTLVDTRLAYLEGDRITFRATHGNTGSSSINLDGLGYITAVRPDDSLLESGDLVAGVYYEFIYDSAENHFQMFNQPASFLIDMDARVDWAEEWAVNPEDDPISTAAGGSGTDFSSLHWATKSSDSASDASTSASLALDAQIAAEAALDEFTDLYLGAKASDPALDNDGDPLQTGALYWNSTNSEMRVYNGATWEDFNQDSYTKSETYSKTEVDTNTYTKTEVDTNTYTKTEVDTNTYTKAQANAAFEPIDSAYTKSESDAKYTITADEPGWTAPTLLNGFTNFGAAHVIAGYRKGLNGVIHVRFMVKKASGDPKEYVFRLPSGYRPSYTLIFAGYGAGGTVRWDILSDGNIEANINGSITYQSLNCSFYPG